MASTHIYIVSTASEQAARLVRFIAELTRIVNDAGDLKAVFDQIAAGGDFAALAAKLGVTAAEAEAVYNLLGGVNTELAATNITQLTARCG